LADPSKRRSLADLWTKARRLYVLGWPYRWRFAFLFFVMMVYAQCSNARALLVQPVIDQVLRPVATTEAAPRPADAEPAPGAIIDRLWDKVLSREAALDEATHEFHPDALGNLKRICLIACVLAITIGVFAYLKSYVSMYLATRVVIDLRGRVTRNLLHLSLRFFHRQNVG